MDEEAQEPRSPSPPPSPPPPSVDVQQSDPEPTEIREEATAINASASAAAPSSFDDVQELEDHGVEEGAEEDGEEAVESGGPVVLTDDLCDKIVRQVEYYFSDENLPTDKFMLKFVRKDNQGFVPIAVIASFRRMKKLVRDVSLIEAALRTSSQLVVCKNGTKVRRLHPLLKLEIKDNKAHTVIVENLPDDHSKDNLQKIFASVGKVINITIHDPHSTELKPALKTGMPFSSKLHALIEYETADAAASAVATLNDEKNWRSGIRVELLLKRMGKYGLYNKGHKQNFPEKNTSSKSTDMASDGQNPRTQDIEDAKAENEEEEHIAGGKGRHKNRYRSRGRAQQSATGQGHGNIPSGSNNGVTSKPVPGPKMPDGTRGFTLGRGKPNSEPYQASL